MHVIHLILLSIISFPLHFIRSLISFPEMMRRMDEDKIKKVMKRMNEI